MSGKREARRGDLVRIREDSGVYPYFKGLVGYLTSVSGDCIVIEVSTKIVALREEITLLDEEGNSIDDEPRESDFERALRETGGEPHWLGGMWLAPKEDHNG